MAKQRRPRPGEKKAATETTEVFFVMQKNDVEEYAKSYNAQTHQLIFSTDLMQALWSYDSTKVDNFITNNNLQNVSTQRKEGGNHPNKPPLP